MSNNKLHTRLFRDATGEYCIEFTCNTLLGKHKAVHRFDSELDRDTFMQYHEVDK